MGLSHSPRIVTDGLVLALDAGNTKSYPGSGTTWTDLIGSNNGTLTNGPTFSSLNGGYIVFDGSNDYVSISDSEDLEFGSGDFTIEAYIYPTGIPQGFYGCIFAKGLPLQCYFMNTNSLSLFVDNANNGSPYSIIDNNNITGNNTVNQDEWTHIAICRSGDTWKVFTGGVQRYSATHSGTIFNNTDVFSIGDYTPSLGTYPFQGYISNLKVYKGKALTATEVEQNYNALKERYAFTPTFVQDGLVLNLDAGDTNSYPGSGTTWTDLSGNSNNGTLTNGPTYSSADGGSIVFDGTDDYVSETSGLSDSFLQGDWTISFWVNFDVITTSSSNGRILLQHGTNSSRSGLHLEQRNSSLIFGLFGDDLGGSQTLSTGTWYNITFTLNSTTRLQQIFVNGSLDNSRTAFGAYVGTGSNTRIGGRALNFSSYLDGKISNVVAYNRVLSAQEISQNYNLLKDRY